MQNVRSNITRLKNLIENKLSNDEDLFGFDGISKVGLIAMVDESHSFSHKLNDLEPDIEITILKRKLAPIFEQLKLYISESKDDEIGKKSFDKFLDGITRIRDEIRMTYLMVNDSGLKSEKYILEIASKANEISSNYKVLSEVFNSLKTDSEKSTALQESIAAKAGDAQKHSKSIFDISTEVSSISAQIKAAHEIIKKYEKTITDLHATANSKSSNVSALNEQVVTLVSDNKNAQSEIAKIKTDLDGQVKINNDLIKRIKNTLDAANRAGLAGAFLDRKNELKVSLILWTIIFVFAIGGILTIGIIFLAPILDNPDKTLSWTSMLIKLAIASPLIWLAWMSARQYGFIARIREDYSYKYACAMSFDGFKKHAEAVDKDLEKLLLNSSIELMSQNPIRLYGARDNHASPVHELINKLLSRKESPEDGKS